MSAAIRIELEPPQRRALQAIQPRSVTVLPWGRGGGKSWFQRLNWYLHIARWDGKHRPGSPHPGVRIVLLMPTLEQAKKVHGSLMLAELSGDWAALGGVVNRSEWRVDFPGGSWIRFVTAEKAQHIRGLRCDVVSGDECDDLDSELLDAIVGPWFSEPHSLGILILSGTPRRGRYGLLYRSHQRGTGKALTPSGKPFADHKSFFATCHDFPHHVSADAIRAERERIAPAIFAREWECDFDSAEGLVYDLFEEDFHVRAPDKDALWSEVIVGVDHGFTDPGCFLVIGVAGNGRHRFFHVLDEVYRTGEQEDWWSSEATTIWRRYPHATWYADPSMPSRINALKRVGMTIRPADNAIEDGVAFVANQFVKRPSGPTKEYEARLYVSPSCRNTIRELGMYRRRRDPRNPEQVVEGIEDKHNHAMDALRYGLFTHFGGVDRGLHEADTGWEFGG